MATKRCDVFESNDGRAFVVWDRQARSRANDDRYRLEVDCQRVVDEMNAAIAA